MFSKFFRSLGSRGKAKKEEKSQSPNNETAIDSPQNASSLIPNQDAQTLDVANARRRLSVDGSHIGLDGIDEMDMEVDIPSLDANANDLFVGVYAGQSQKGYVPFNPHKVNQDWMLIREDKATGTLILGVFDGHGEHGQCVSEFVCNSFYTYLIAHTLFVTDLKTAAVESLHHAEQDCIANRFIKTEFSGTTAVVCIIRGSYLLALNVGDSRAVIAYECNDQFQVADLTRDHKPDLPEEKRRIEQAGGRVFAMEYEDGFLGPSRVWLHDQDIPGLAMSRSLGDTVAHSVGVISTPEVFERTLTVDDRVVVLGSDGLWEFLPSMEAIQLIEDCEQPEDAVERLSATAWKRWFDEEKVVDDTTIIVVFLGKMNVQ